MTKKEQIKETIAQGIQKMLVDYLNGENNDKNSLDRIVDDIIEIAKGDLQIDLKE